MVKSLSLTDMLDLPVRCMRSVVAAGVLAAALAAVPAAIAADETAAQSSAPASRAVEPLKVQVGSIQSQRVIWHGRHANGPASTTLREPLPRVCNPLTASVANGFDNYSGGSSMILQLGTVQGEGFGSSYTFPAAAFPIEITEFDCYFGSIANVTTTTGWRLDVYDGPPTTGTVVFTVLSSSDPGDPGDVLMNPAGASCSALSGATANAVKLQFSVDQTADPNDRMIVNNTSGTGIITVVLRLVRVNHPGGACTTLDPCQNAFLGFEGQGQVLNFPNDNWLYAVSCAGGAPSGYTSFANLSPTYRPTTDTLQEIIFVPTNCAAIPSGACCLTTGNCVAVTSQNCTSQNGTYKGDNSACATANCPQPNGACCLPFGGCDARAQSSCLNVSGVFQGANSVCASVQCPDPSGACCAGTTCAGIANLSTCNALGGTFEGNATTCTLGGACPLGACCLIDGSCILNESGPQCALQGGTFKGVGTTCTNANCPQPSGACCTTTPACVSVPQAQCLAFSGNVWKGAFTTCSPSPCAGVCCRGVTCSSTLTQAQCTGVDSKWVSTAAAVCNAQGNIKTPCCRGDFNKVSNVTVQDIFDYLAAWFAHNPIADYHNNGAGAPSVQSLFDFLAAWFQGPCT